MLAFLKSIGNLQPHEKFLARNAAEIANNGLFSDICIIGEDRRRDEVDSCIIVGYGPGRNNVPTFMATKRKKNKNQWLADFENLRLLLGYHEYIDKVKNFNEATRFIATHLLNKFGILADSKVVTILSWKTPDDDQPKDDRLVILSFDPILERNFAEFMARICVGNCKSKL